MFLVFSEIFSDWRVYAVLAAVFASLTAIFAKIGIEGVPSNLGTLIRTVVVLVFLVCVTAIGREFSSLREISSRAWKFLLLSGFATGLSWACYFKALKLGPVTKVAPIDKMSLGLTVALAIIFLGEPFTWKLFFGAALIISGSIILIL